MFGVFRFHCSVVVHLFLLHSCAEELFPLIFSLFYLTQSGCLQIRQTDSKVTFHYIQWKEIEPPEQAYFTSEVRFRLVSKLGV